jgi:hypothetical protein
MSLSYSPQVRRRLRLPCFYGRTLSRTVPAACTSPPCQNPRSNPKIRRLLEIFTNSYKITKILTRLLSVLSLSQKFVHDHCCCQYLLSYSQPPNQRPSSRSSEAVESCPKWGRDTGGGGGGTLIGAFLPARFAGAQVASGYTTGDTVSCYHSSVSFSLSTFLCIVASWAVVDKNIHTMQNNCNKYTFCIIKSSEPQKNLKPAMS